MIILNQSIIRIQNYATWIQIALVFRLKLRMFMKTLQMMLRKDLIHEVNRPLPTRKNKKVIGLMKDELGGKNMTEFVVLRPKTYSYLLDGGDKNKKAIIIIKTKIILKSKQRFKSEAHIYIEKINKIPLSSNDDKRLQTFDRITSYPYGISAGNVCKTELLEYKK